MPPVPLAPPELISPSVVGQHFDPDGTDLPINSPLVNLPAPLLQKYDITDLGRQLEDLQLQYNFQICGHVSQDREGNAVFCCVPAGTDTSHPGYGRCARHAGVPALSPYARYLRGHPTLQAVFTEFMERQQSFRQLDAELALARSVLTALLRELQVNSRARNTETFGQILLYLEQIRKLSESMSKIQQMQAQGITVESISAFLWQVQTIIDQELVDTTAKARIFDRIATECEFVAS